MNNRECAAELVTTIINSFDRTSSVDAILAHDDEIRRECAEKAVEYCTKYEGFLNGVDDQYLFDAIMGKE